VIPAGALTTTVDVRIAEEAAGAPSLPNGFVAVGPVLAFTPHGVSFVSPVTVRVPFDPTKLPSGLDPVLLKAEPGGSFSPIAATRNGDALVASVDGFSWLVAARDQSQGELRVVIDADSEIYGYSIVTGPAGIVYVSGATRANLDGQHPGLTGDVCFVAKLTVSLDFEWVRQFPGCQGGLSVGPTGNVHFATFSANPNSDPNATLQITSLNLSGAVRSGFPVTIGRALGPNGIDYAVTQIAVDVQDDLSVLGYRVVAPYDPLFPAFDSRSYVAQYSSSGQVKQAPTPIDFADSVTEYDAPLSIALSSAGLWVAAQFQERPSGLGGYFLQLYTPSGTAAPGFPQRFADTKNPANFVSVPSALMGLPGTDDVIAIGAGRVDGNPPRLVRYQPSGAIAPGFPKDLATGSNKVFARTNYVYGQMATDGQGNLFAVMQVEDPGANTNPIELVLLSYTEDGALRAGYPLHLATVPRLGTSQPSGDLIGTLAVNDTGSLYLSGAAANATNPALHSLVIRRMPAK
jgi:hypothetical protein